MPYIARDDANNIVSVHADPTPEAIAYLEDDHPEVRRFLAGSAKTDEVKQDLVTTDADMVRVIEDVVETLIRKGVIQLTDMPEAAVAKLGRRKRLRSHLSQVPLLVPSDDIPI